jgi:hypothetical protein
VLVVAVELQQYQETIVLQVVAVVAVGTHPLQTFLQQQVAQLLTQSERQSQIRMVVAPHGIVGHQRLAVGQEETLQRHQLHQAGLAVLVLLLAVQAVLVLLVQPHLQVMAVVEAVVLAVLME